MCSSVMLGMVGIDMWEWSVLTCWVWSVLTCGRGGQCLIFDYVFLSDAMIFLLLEMGFFDGGGGVLSVSVHTFDICKSICHDCLD